MFKKSYLLFSLVLLSSCTAETYVEFDELNLTVNGLEVQSSVQVDPQTASQTTSQTSTNSSVDEVYIEKLDLEFYRNLDALAEVEIDGNIFYLQSIQEIRNDDWATHITESFGQESSGAIRVVLTPDMFPESDLDYNRLYLHFRIEDSQFLYLVKPYDEYDNGEDDFSLVLNHIIWTPHPNFENIENLWNAFVTYLETSYIVASISSSCDEFANIYELDEYIADYYTSFTDNFKNSTGVPIADMALMRWSHWDNWGATEWEEGIKIGAYVIDFGIDIDNRFPLNLTIIFNYDTGEPLMFILFLDDTINTPSYFQNRYHVGIGSQELIDTKRRPFSDNVEWVTCSGEAFDITMEKAREILVDYLD